MNYINGLIVPALITAPQYTYTLSKADVFICVAVVAALFPLLKAIRRRTTGAKRTVLCILAVVAALYVCLVRLAPAIIDRLIVY